MLADFEKVVSGLSFSVPVLPVVSGLTGGVSEEIGSPGYWVRHVREAVRFADAVAYTAAHGVTSFVEIGPDAVLAGMGTQSVEDGLFVPAQRRNRSETQTAVSALARLHTAGARVDWAGFYAGSGARRVDLPTYAFQRERYWLVDDTAGESPRALGLASADHPLLGAVVTIADADETLFTGRLAVGSHPWVADHNVLGSVLLPGTAFVELAVRAGDHVGCNLLEELTLQAPLVLPERGGVVVQIAVGAADESGRRSVSVYSRDEDSDQAPWIRHAEGILGHATVVPAAVLTEWPPPGAVPIRMDGAYDLLAERGYGYGPVFQGLKAAWSSGEELYAEIALPESAHADAQRFGVHPALLDAAMHVALLDSASGTEETTVLPFAWTDVALHAAGASTLRVRIAPAGPDSVAVLVADGAGQPVLTVGALVSRPVSVGQLSAGGSGGLWEVAWRPVSGAGAAISVGSAVSGATVFDVVAECGGGLSGSDVVSGVRLVTGRVLGVVQEWLSGAGGGGGPLVVVTRGAVAVSGGEGVDVCQAPVWGLVRAAQAENPGRFVLLDVDVEGVAGVDVAGVVASGEPE
ncbi:polyketide synthase dehydratase domain-containing protein, partial [Streptomyces sp. DT171]|uniref:polyketide synthase dehydratase domain-containing protein n=1 Tax=Streptomyces sp. DT171 TaxID=3416524 RepID=UPI003CF605A8